MEPTKKKRGVITVKVEKIPKTYRERANSDYQETR